jgi:predicted metal-dependent enzyme (double-stranded beta helix superfamily)
MCDTGYTVRDLAADLKALQARGLDEAAMLDEASELAKRLVLMKHNWLRSYMTTLGADDGATKRHVLHEEPDHSLAIFVVTAGPGQESPPHDHGTWGVIAGLEGRQAQRLWKRAGDEVERAGETAIDAATVVTLPSDTIHSLHNDSDTVAVTLHLYGMNLDYTQNPTYKPTRPS